MALIVLLAFGSSALAAWFWVHCARPCLVAFGARPLAFRLVLSLTVLYGAASLAFGGAPALHIGSAAVYWFYVAAGVAWTVVVGLGFLNSYKVLMRVTGGRDVQATVRYAIYGVGYSLGQIRAGSLDRRWPQLARDATAKLAELRTEETASLIDLWSAEVAIVLDGTPSDRPDEERYEALRDAHRRLWPTAEEL